MPVAESTATTSDDPRGTTHERAHQIDPRTDRLSDR